ncbi:MAG: hypothetical protein ACRBN8_39840 [Nannocystales bacterium]
MKLSRKLAIYSLLSAISAPMVGCDEEPLKGPEVQRLDEGFVVLGSGADVLQHRDASVFVELGDAETQPWEPGNGYFQPNRDDPEDAVYFDTCDAAGTPSPVESVDRILVDADNESLAWTVLVSFVPEGEEHINASTGLPLEVGDEFVTRECEFSSSYARCVEERISFDFTQLPFPGAPEDARLVDRLDAHMYWDYGQDRFRVLRHSTVGCEGADCDSHPFVLTFLAQIGAEESCESMSMSVYDRVPTPVVD